MEIFGRLGVLISRKILRLSAKKNICSLAPRVQRFFKNITAL